MQKESIQVIKKVHSVIDGFALNDDAYMPITSTPKCMRGSLGDIYIYDTKGDHDGKYTIAYNEIEVVSDDMEPIERRYWDYVYNDIEQFDSIDAALARFSFLVKTYCKDWFYTLDDCCYESYIEYDKNENLFYVDDIYATLCMFGTTALMSNCEGLLFVCTNVEPAHDGFLAQGTPICTGRTTMSEQIDLYLKLKDEYVRGGTNATD